MSEKLSLHQQEYIEVIYQLCCEKGCAHSKDIADALNVKMPSVTEALHYLRDKGMVIYKTRHPARLTQKGVKIGRELGERHRVLRNFMCNILGLSYEYSDSTACRIEHVIDSKLKERLSEFISFLEGASSVDYSTEINTFKQSYK